MKNILIWYWQVKMSYYIHKVMPNSSRPGGHHGNNNIPPAKRATKGCFTILFLTEATPNFACQNHMCYPSISLCLTNGDINIYYYNKYIIWIPTSGLCKTALFTSSHLLTLYFVQTKPHPLTYSDWKLPLVCMALWVLTCCLLGLMSVCHLSVWP